MVDKSAQAVGDQMAEQVKQAFQRVRQGDLGPVSGLQEMGAALIPHLAPYLEDASEDVRRETVSLLGSIGSEPALPLLGRALLDACADIQERATQALWERFTPVQLAANPEVGDALRASVERGNPAARARLLLINFPGPQTERVLRADLQRAPSSPMKLFAWSAPVPAALPAHVALARLGDGPSRQSLLRTAAGTSLGELQFLLAVLPDLDAPEALHAVARALDDQRETGSAMPAGVEPQRRLCDDAVNAFVQRLGLQVSFPLSDVQVYSPAQIDEVRRKIKAAIPQ